MYLADTLSRAALPDPVRAEVTGFEVFGIEKSKEIEIKRDPILSQLYAMIIKGWPDEKQKVAKELQQYWNYRDELTIQNDIIYKCHQILIPESMQADMLSKIHVNHLGANPTIAFVHIKNTQLDDKKESCPHHTDNTTTARFRTYFS